MLSRARLALVRSQCILRSCKGLAARTSSPYLLESPRSMRSGKSARARNAAPIIELDSDEVSDGDIDTSPLDILLRSKPAVFKSSKLEDTEGLPERELILDEEEARDPRYILGRKLLNLGKINFRHIEHLPEWLRLRIKDVCDNRTTAQVRRRLENWMVKVDRDVLESYRVKKLGWKKDAKVGKSDSVVAYGPEETVAYAHYFMPSRYSITKRILQETQKILPSLQPKRVLDFGCGPGSAGAAVAVVFKESFEKYVGIDVSRSMIDAAKSIMAGAREVAGTDSVFYEKTGEVLKRADQKGDRFDMVIASYTLSELPSDAARRAATQVLFELLDDGGVLVIIEAGHPQGSHTVRTARQLLLDNFNRIKRPDIDTKSDDKNEEKRRPTSTPSKTDAKKNIKVGEDSIEFDAKSVKSKAAPQKMDTEDMLMVLPAPKGMKHEDMGAFVIAPCTHDKVCPLEVGTWCSFSQKIHSGLIRLESEEKFSYVIIQKRALTKFEKGKADREDATGRPKQSAVYKASAPKGTESPILDLWTTTHGSLKVPKTKAGPSTVIPNARTDPTPLEVLARFTKAKDEELPQLVWDLIDEVDWEEYDPPLYRQQYGRVIRSPIKATGHVTMDLCMPNGSIGRNVLSKGNVMHVPSLYTALRKTTWGGLVPVLQDDMFRSAFTEGRSGVVPKSPRVSRDARAALIREEDYVPPEHGRKKKIFAPAAVVDINAMKAKLRRKRKGEEYDEDDDEEEEEEVERRRGVRERPTRAVGKERMTSRDRDRERERDKGRIRQGSRQLQYEEVDDHEEPDDRKKINLKSIMSKSDSQRSQLNREKMEVPPKPSTKSADTPVKSAETPVPEKKTGRLYLRPKPVRPSKPDAYEEVPVQEMDKMDEKMSLKEAQNRMFRNIVKERKEKNDKE